MAPSSSAIEAIFQVLSRQNPSPQTELDYTNSYTLLVAVALSAQSTDKGVNKATKALFTIADTPQKMIDLGIDGLMTHIRTIGLYKTKAKHVMATAHKLVQEHGGQVPQTREALEKLPGVGRKTANVVLSVAFGQPTLAVDTHIFRVAHRLGLSKGKTPLQVEQDLLAVIPQPYLYHAHQWLILHGRYVCRARNPLCTQCPVLTWCPYGHCGNHDNAGSQHNTGETLA